MSYQENSLPHLSGIGLITARLVWLVLMASSIGLFILALPPRFDQLLADPYTMRPGLAELGLTPRQFAVYGTVLDIIVAVGFIGLAVLLFLKGSQDWVALLFSLTTGMFIITILPVTSVLSELNPIWQVPYLFLRGMGFTSFCAAMLIFPDGRFVPRWSRFFLVFIFIYVLLWPVFPQWAPITDLDFSNSPEPGRIIWMVIAFILLAAFQVYRYRNVSTLLQRQQTRWVVVGIAVEIAIFILVVLLGLFLPSIQTSPKVYVTYFLIGIPVILVSSLLFPLSVIIAVLRHRLWDIDLVIRRTLQYSLLTGLLSLLYFGMVTLFQAALSTIGGPSSTLAIVLTTLLIYVLFNPLRWRIQDFLDRRFYRQKYDTEKALAEFSETARSETDLEQLTAEMIQVAGKTLQPAKIFLWLIQKTQ